VITVALLHETRMSIAVLITTALLAASMSIAVLTTVLLHETRMSIAVLATAPLLAASMSIAVLTTVLLHETRMSITVLATASLLAARMSIAVLTTFLLHETRMSIAVLTAAHPLNSNYAPGTKIQHKPSIPCLVSAFYKIVKNLDIFRLRLLRKEKRIYVLIEISNYCLANLIANIHNRVSELIRLTDFRRGIVSNCVFPSPLNTSSTCTPMCITEMLRIFKLISLFFFKI